MNRKLTALAGAAALWAALAGGMACAAEPGDTARRVEDLLRQMTLEKRSLYDDRMQWAAEPGKFEVMVGRMISGCAVAST